MTAGEVLRAQCSNEYPEVLWINDVHIARERRQPCTALQVFCRRSNKTDVPLAHTERWGPYRLVPTVKNKAHFTQSNRMSTLGLSARS